jgi:hypothetical protein
MVTDERSPERGRDLEDESERGELSKEGFGDYDKEFHPTDVEHPAEGGESDSSNRGQPSSPNDAAALRPLLPVEVHVHWMRFGAGGTSPEEDFAQL